MFSSNALVHLVFADPMDEYCSDGLLKLDLDRYLWLKLHERFSSVYFLRAEDHGFAVKTFGDRKAKNYEPSQGFLKSMKGIFSGKSETQRFGDWMLEQMKSMRSEAAAFVCSAEDFCRTASGADWNAVLRQLAGEKNRTGILVLKMPLEAERSRELLLESPAFAQLGDATVSDLRGGSLQPLFPTLANGKKDACCFLSPSSGEGLHAILLRLQLENPQLIVSEEESRAAEEYLRRYLRNLHLQESEPLFRSGEPALYLSYRDLYLQLKDKRVWNELLARARNQSRLSEGMLLPAAALPLDRTGITGRCAGKLFTENLSAGTSSSRPPIPDRILANLLTPRNRPENKAVAEAMEGFLQKLSAADPEDGETFQKIVEALGFCADWLYVPEEREEKEIVLALVERQNINLELSSLKYQTRNKFQNASLAGGDLLDAKLRQMKIQADTIQRTADQYQDLISSSMLDLSLSSFSPREVFAKLSGLEEKLSELWTRKDPEQPPDMGEELPSLKDLMGRQAEEGQSSGVPETAQPEEPPETETGTITEPGEPVYDPNDFGKLSPEQEARLFEL